MSIYTLDQGSIRSTQAPIMEIPIFAPKVVILPIALL